MTYFVSVLFLAVLACALFFSSLELPTNFRSFKYVLLRTLFTSFFSDLDPFAYIIDNPFKVLSFFINIMVLVGISLICMNAMIAFIVEKFADILEDKVAVIARQKASILMDLYSEMSVSRRKEIDMVNRWTFKLELQSTLDKINVNSAKDDEVTNKRATKGDIGDSKTESGEKLDNMKAEMDKKKAKMKGMKAEMEKAVNTEMNKLKAEMEKTMKAETKELKAELKRQ